MNIQPPSRLTVFVIAIVLLFAAVLAFFWRPVTALVVHWAFQGYTRVYLDASFSAGEITFAEGELLFKDFIFEKKVSHKTKIKGHGNEMGLAFRLYPSEGESSLFFRFQSPSLEVLGRGDSSGSFTDLLTHSSAATSLASVDISILDGSVIFKDTSTGNQSHFEVTGNCSSKQGTYTLSCSKGGISQCSYDSGEWHFSSEALNLADVNHALSIMGIHPLGINVQQGVLNGEIFVCMDEEDLPDLYGNLHVNECIFSSKTGDMHGYIPRASILLKDASPSGEFTLGKGAYFEYTQEGKPPISFSQLEGRFSLPAYDRCFIEAQGLCTHHGHPYRLGIDGHISVSGHEKAACELEIILEGEQKQPVRACVSSARQGLGHSQIFLNLQNIGAGEWDLLMLVLGTQDIGLEPYTLLDGVIDARIRLDLENFKTKQVYIEEFVARGVAFNLDQSEISAKIGHAEGHLSLDLSVSNVLDTLQASFAISEGVVHFAALNKEQWQLSQLVTQLTIENGVLKDSFVEADFMGLRGLIEVNWAAEKAMHVQFKGDVSDLAHLLPENRQREVLKRFKEDSLSIEADVWRRSLQLEILGVIEINSLGKEFPECIHTGFILEKTLTGSRFLNLSSELSVHPAGNIIEAIAKRLVKSKGEPAAEWIKEELRIVGYSLKNGWFTATQLPTEKYVEPVFFHEGQMAVSGMADFRAHFDCDGLDLEYFGENLLLENDEFAFESGIIAFEKPAKHYFDFIQDTDEGVFPVTNGTYFDKNSGLLFVDVEGTMTLKEKTLYIPFLKTTCNHVVFTGSIDLDHSSPQKKVFDIEIKTRSMEGSYANVRDLFSHFNQTASLIDLPLDGNVSLTEKGSVVRLAFRPSGCQVEAFIEGRLHGGKLQTRFPELSVHGIGFEFAYDHAHRGIDIKKMAGSVGLKGREALVLGNGNISFSGLENGLMEFDIPILSGSQEVLRLHGCTQQTLNDNLEDLTSLILNPQISHYRGSHPEKVNFTFKDGLQIDSVDFLWNLDLKHCFEDAYEIAGMALNVYMPQLITPWNNLTTPSGAIGASVHYEHLNQLLSIRLEADNVQVGDSHYDRLILATQKRRHVWSIEQFQVDSISAAADFIPTENGYKINFLGLRYGDVLLMGLDGSYDLEKAAFDGDINLLEIDFSQFSRWKSFRELVNDYHPQGQMKGTGSVHIALNDQWPPLVQMNLKTSVRNCALRDLHFEAADDIQCEFVLGDRLVFNDCRSGLRCIDSECTQGLFHVNRALYDFKKEEISLEGLHFHADAENLDWIANKLELVFPEAVSSGAAQILRHVKGEGSFRGVVDLQMNDDNANISMRLPKGRYKLGSKEHEISDFVLCWDRKNLNAVCQYRFQNTLYWLTVKSTSPAIDAGEIYVSAYPPDAQRPLTIKECLCINWYMHPQYGMVVEKAQGRLPGLIVELARDRLYPMNPQSWHLDGDIILDPEIGSHIMPPDIVQALASWKISRNYRLKGKWIFMLEAPNEGEIYFQGNLKGEEVVLKGCVVGGVNAELNCTPDRIDMTNMVFHDSAGRLSVPSSSMLKQSDGNWWVYAPSVIGENFRPCLLRELATPPSPLKPLVISRFEVNNIVCRADNLSTMTGSGKLVFNNAAKKTIHNPLLAIPAEIISRIGLNLDVLNPTSGTIFFEIQDYKVKLTKFKDVYSEGKLSKFYLPKNNYVSFVDLDGHVHVQVSMKQYNLLFKLAELFTVTINGTLQKPLYTLQKK